MLEVAILNVRPGRSRAFEDAFREAQEIISASRGYQRHELRRCVEVADRYLLLVWWDSLESHTEGFRRSAEYQRWSELLHDFYDPFPTVEHYAPVPEAPDVDTSFDEFGKRASSGDPEARARILSLGKSALPAVQRGLTHPDWKVRRDCLRFLDHHIDAESAQRVLALLRDDHPEVRKWAAHALGCDHCKSGADLGFDPVPHLIVAVTDDPSVKVRRSATVCLAWTQPPDTRIRDFLTTLLESETDKKIRKHAEGGAARHASELGAG